MTISIIVIAALIQKTFRISGFLLKPESGNSVFSGNSTMAKAITAKKAIEKTIRRQCASPPNPCPTKPSSRIIVYVEYRGNRYIKKRMRYGNSDMAAKTIIVNIINKILFQLILLRHRYGIKVITAEL